METQITFSIMDIGILVLWSLGVVILVLLIGILLSAYKSMRDINKIIKDNKDNINKILDEAPGITKNINTISGEVAHGTEAFRPTIDNIADTSGSVTGAINENSDIVSGLTTAFSVMSAIKSGFDKLFSKKTSDNSSESKKSSFKKDHENSGEETSSADASKTPMDSWDNIRNTTESVASMMSAKKSDK